MILRILLIACTMLLPPSIAKMGLGTFTEKFEKNCFQNNQDEPFKVYGQDTPLSNTMDNFISMAEKFEVANPNTDLRDELIFFLSEYLFENIKITNGKVSERTVERAKLDIVESLWDPEGETYRPEFLDPFSDEEKCSLYFMISHSILEKDTALPRSNGNFSSNPARTDLKADDYYPQELGVVEIRGADGAVSLSKVLIGLFVGLNEHRKSDLSSYTLHFKEVNKQEKLSEKVDSLYVTTLAEVLMLSSWDGSERPGLAKNGVWVSIPLSNGEKIERFCPMVHKQETPENKKLPAYSYSSVRGAADGLILGLTVRQVYTSDTKLSQILRMYYSPRGIIVDTTIEDTDTKEVSSCNREQIIQVLESKVYEQMSLYGYLVAITENDVDKSYGNSRSRYDKHKGEIYTNRGNGYCLQPKSLDKPEDLHSETFLDVIVVMDSSNTEKNFIDQQLIIGNLAKQMDLRHSGSRMTILLDQKISLNSASSTIELKPIVNDSYSTSCAACTVGQIAYEQSTVPREEVILAVDQLLQWRKDNETSLNGANGKVVINFNYESTEGRNNNNKLQGKVTKALRDLNLRHQDVLLYAVGLDPELLKKYARNDPSLVFLGTDDKPEEIADKIYKKLSYAPTLLQYSDCILARNEKLATYESFVSPSKIQHYTMPPEYFYKSYNAKVVFESQNGLVRVCYNRGTMKPENEKKHCKDTTPNSGVEFKVSNPCQGFTKESCSPLYFAVMGIEPAPETNGNQAQRQKAPCKTNERCSTLDQIKFRVSHEGIRCSGCLGLGAPPAVILFTVLLTYFLYKRF